MTSFLKSAALVALCALASCTKPLETASYSVVPLPSEVTPSEGTPFRLNSRTSVFYPTGNALLKRNAEFLSEYVAQSMNFALPVREQAEGEAPEHAITLVLDSTINNEEGYRLSVTEKSIRIEGRTEQGIFYGIQTLRKSLPAVAESKSILLPAAVVNDEPRFTYRAMHLDVCRHFFPVEFVKKYIDLLALHNMNTFHWHLTDDQGWRIEIKRYPRLTQVGAWRSKSQIGSYEEKPATFEFGRYGGFYTQDEIREVVAYAAERYITVIPEIEMPGHSLAALTAYPWLGCTNGDESYEIAGWICGPGNVLCPGKESTFEFLENVLDEVVALFPSNLIHIGGDECPKGRWKACPLCQQRIREEGLKDEYQLQSYFIHRIERWMHTHGREIIGWDEILQGGISKTANIMSWNGSDPGIKAAQRGNPVIMTPKWYCYFDYSQTSDPERYEPLGNTRYVSVRQAYRLDPCDRLTLPDQKRIRGVQCNLWTEYIADIRHAQHMVLPRMAALAETGWANDRKDYNDFVRRIPVLVAVYKAEGYNYAPYLFEGIE